MESQNRRFERLKTARNLVLILLLCGQAVPMNAEQENLVKAARENVLPAKLAKALKLAQEVTLYSLDPVAVGEGKTDGEKLVNWMVLGKIEIKQTSLARTAIDLFVEAYENGAGEVGLCFEPRHALRVKDGTETFDFIMCFKCHLAAVYRGNERVAVVQMRGSPAWYNELLQAAGIRVAE